MIELVPKKQYEQIKATLRQRTHFTPSENRIDDFLTVGIYHFVGGAQDFARWSLKMREDFGESIRPHVEQIWLGMPGEARKIADRLLAPILKHVEVAGIEMAVSQFAVIKRASVGNYGPPPQPDVWPAAPTQPNRAIRTVSTSGDLTHETESHRSMARGTTPEPSAGPPESPKPPDDVVSIDKKREHRVREHLKTVGAVLFILANFVIVIVDAVAHPTHASSSNLWGLASIGLLLLVISTGIVVWSVITNSSSHIRDRVEGFLFWALLVIFFILVANAGWIDAF